MTRASVSWVALSIAVAIAGVPACGSGDSTTPPHPTRREDPDPEPEPPPEEASRFCPALFSRAPTSGNPRPQNRDRPSAGVEALRAVLREEGAGMRRERDGASEEGRAGNASDTVWAHYQEGAASVRIDVIDLVHVCTLRPGTGRALVANGRGLPPDGQRREIVVEGHPAVAVQSGEQSAMSLVVADRCWVLVHANGSLGERPVEAVTRELVDFAALARVCR